jgi:hypothetical protein
MASLKVQSQSGFPERGKVVVLEPFDMLSWRSEKEGDVQQSLRYLRLSGLGFVKLSRLEFPVIEHVGMR